MTSMEKIRFRIDRSNQKIEQLKKDLPALIWSSNLISAQLVDVSRKIGDDIIRIEIKGQIRDKAMAAIASDGFEIESITCRRSTLIIFVKDGMA